MRKKWVSALLSAAMCITLLAGCGGNTNQTASGDTADTKQEEQVSADTQADGSDAAGTASGEKITLQFWNVFTGSDGDILREASAEAGHSA